MLETLGRARGLFYFQYFAQFRLVKIDNDGAVDIKSGCGQRAIGPLAHLLGCARHRVEIHLGVFQLVFLQPGARLFAIGTPTGAVHDDTPVRQLDFLWLDLFWLLCGSFWVNLTQDIVQHLVIGLFINIMNIDVTDDALFIDDENGPLGMPFAAQHAVLFGHFAMGPEITQQGIVDAAQAFSPGLQTGYMIDTDAQNLGVQSREFGFFSLVGRDLIGSYRCPGEGKECQYHILPAQITQGDLFIQVAG